MLLEDRNAVVYGGGGAVGGAVARAFAQEGATVFLAGRSLAPMERVAEGIAAEGGRAEVAEIDVLDADQVDDHARSVAEAAGSIDVSFNAVGHGDVHGTPLIDMSFGDFVTPVWTAMRSHFVTARAAARHMVRRGSGVIMSITATTARGPVPNVGGTGVAFDAIESLCRQWARELGPKGVRVVWLHTTGIPEALKDSGELQPDYGLGKRLTNEEHVAWMRGATMLGRLTSLDDVGNMAAFLASDRAAAVTAAGANLSCGMVPSR